MKRFVPHGLVAIVAVVDLSWGIFLYHSKQFALSVTSSPAQLQNDAHVLGNASAKVTLEEYGDFQCPPCAAVSEPVNDLEKNFRPQLRVVFHNFPLPSHAHAREAAHAAEAAGLQGKFWPMHDLLYRTQGVWSRQADVNELFASYAASLGADVPRFVKDMHSEAVKEQVDADHRHGEALGVKNTPTIFINNHVVAPMDLAPDRLRAAVLDAMNPKKAP